MGTLLSFEQYELVLTYAMSCQIAVLFYLRTYKNMHTIARCSMTTFLMSNQVKLFKLHNCFFATFQEEVLGGALFVWEIALLHNLHNSSFYLTL